MNAVLWILSGGFLKGYRTYIMVGMAVLATVVQYAVGDIDLTQMITNLGGELSVGTLRAAVPPSA